LEQKTKRIVVQTLKNLGKLFGFVGVIMLYMFTCLWISHEYFGDILFGIAAFFVPVMFYAVWDQSKNQVESQIYNEERTIDALKREY